jgi:hypothetical protein
VTFTRCYYHPRTDSIITDRDLLESDTVGKLMRMLPEEERYGLKYVTVCLEDRLAGKIDRDSLVSALEMFGQIRDTGVSRRTSFEKSKKKRSKSLPPSEPPSLCQLNGQPARCDRIERRARGCGREVRRNRKARIMESVEESIIVRAPIDKVYEQWNRIEDFPKFMPAVREMRRINENNFHWRVKRGEREYEAMFEVVLRIPEHRELGNETRVTFKMKYVPNAGWASPATLLARLNLRLKNFKGLIEAAAQTPDTK